MRAKGSKICAVLLAGVFLAGCASDNPRLLNVTSSTSGPDEFAILPNKPLQQPTNFTDLPTPTPGGSNRTDVNPIGDAIVALGGNPAAVGRGIPSSDAGVVNHASRYGRDPGIRRQIAAEDLAFRKRKDGRPLERLFNVNVYFRAYRGQSLDQYAELERFRRAGVRTPAAPPQQ